MEKPPWSNVLTESNRKKKKKEKSKKRKERKKTQFLTRDLKLFKEES